MNFEFSEDQIFLKNQANKLLFDQGGASVCRHVTESGASFDRSLWDTIVKMGWTGAAIPERYGGHGLGHLELCVIAEELGRIIAPTPFASTVYLAAEALMLAGSEAQKEAHLPRIASGEAIGTLAVFERAGRLVPNALECSFADGKISGSKLPVPDGDVADIAVVAARDGGGDGIVLALVDLTGSGVSRSRIESFDGSRSQASITFEEAPAEILAKAGDGWVTLHRLFERAAVMVAFEQIGGAEQCLETAKAYALERHAFGRPIGSYQALKHKMADMYTKNVLARSNAYYGAWALSTDAPELPLAAAAARISAIQAYKFAAEESLHIHGGMGFTWEVDCHLYARRAKHLALVLGSEGYWKQRLVAALERQAA